MLTNYVPSQLEVFISTLYKKLGITNPEDIKVDRIAKRLGIHLEISHHRNYSYIDNEIKIINLNGNLNELEKKKVFFHELAHLLFHQGNQIKLPNDFRDYQENQANNFIMYALIPYHMLDINSINSYKDMAYYFQTDETICLDRIDKIRSNILSRKEVKQIG